jgi:hypothetical protein
MFVKGQSGNPSGRPKSKPISDELRRLGEAGAYVQVAKVLLDRALGGDIRAIQEFTNRIEGKLTDKIDVQAGSADLLSLLTKRSTNNGHGTPDAEQSDDAADSSGSGDAENDRADS